MEDSDPHAIHILLFLCIGNPPITGRTRNVEFWSFFGCCWPYQNVEQTIELPVITVVMTFMPRYYNATVILTFCLRVRNIRVYLSHHALRGGIDALGVILGDSDLREAVLPARDGANYLQNYQEWCHTSDDDGGDTPCRKRDYLYRK